MTKSESRLDPIAIALDVGRHLDTLGVRYVIGGSLASSVHGEPRSTLDVDLVADLRPGQAGALADALDATYYIDRDVVGGSFNAIHVASAIKVDFFVAGSDPFEAERLAQRIALPVAGGGRAMLWFDTPEHVIVRKLEWFRRGDEVSDRQWRDVRAIVAVQGDRLDRNRIEVWAKRLGVADLVRRLFAEC